jgi:DNA-nicking Smr family endonuclease
MMNGPLDEEGSPEPVILSIEDTLDLHTFHPREVGALIPDYLEACREKGVLEVRVIHGKGKGFLRERVHAILQRLDWVAEFHLADREGGDWGSTVVRLRPTVHPHSGGLAGGKGEP